MHFNGGKMPPSLMACWALLPEGRNIVAKCPHAERDTKPHGGVRTPAVGGVCNAHVTHGKDDINVRTAQRWQDHTRVCNPRHFRQKDGTSSRSDTARSAESCCNRRQVPGAARSLRLEAPHETARGARHQLSQNDSALRVIFNYKL